MNKVSFPFIFLYTYIEDFWVTYKLVKTLVGSLMPKSYHNDATSVIYLNYFLSLSQNCLMLNFDTVLCKLWMNINNYVVTYRASRDWRGITSLVIVCLEVVLVQLVGNHHKIVIKKWLKWEEKFNKKEGLQKKYTLL